jgi:hypothetical protein
MVLQYGQAVERKKSRDRMTPGRTGRDIVQLASMVQDTAKWDYIAGGNVGKWHSFRCRELPR